MDEPVVFGTSFAALFQHGLPGPLSPGAQARLRGVGLDLSRPLLPAYALSTWVRALAIAAEEVHGGESPGRAYELLGREVIRGLQSVPTGKARHATNVALGVRRALERMTQNFRVSNNYLETTLEARGPSHFGLEMRVVPALLPQVERDGLPPPAFYAGVFAETIAGWGAREVRVELESEDRQRRAYRFAVRYTEPAEG